MNKKNNNDELIKYIIKNIEKIPKIIFNEITFFGGNLFFLFISCLFLFIGEIILFLQLIAGYILFTTIGILIRFIYFKERPKKLEHSNLIEKVMASSFPSMHSTRAFYLFIVMINYSKIFEVKLFFIIILTLVLYSRIYLKKHDLEDIFYGCVLAGFTYWLVIFCC